MSSSSFDLIVFVETKVYTAAWNLIIIILSDVASWSQLNQIPMISFTPCYVV